jgi:hypothetical protein
MLKGRAKEFSGSGNTHFVVVQVLIILWCWDGSLEFRLLSSLRRP